MADKIVSWGGYESKGTSGMSVTGSLAVSGSGRFTDGLTITGSAANRSTRITEDGYYLSRLSDGIYASSITANGNMSYNTRNSHLFLNDGIETIRFVSDTRNVLIGTVLDSARLVVKGSGTTSSTTSLLVQNSAGTTALQVLDSLNVGINATPTTSRLKINSGTLERAPGTTTSIVEIDISQSSSIQPGSSTPSAIYINGTFTNTNTNNNTIVNPVLDVNPLFTTQGSGGIVTWGGGANKYLTRISPSISTYSSWSDISETTFTLFNSSALARNITSPKLINVTPNFTAGTNLDDPILLNLSPSFTGNNRIQNPRGIYYNPSLTGPVTNHRAIETTSGDVIFNGGNVGIGTSTPNEKVHVSGLGNVTLSVQSTNGGRGALKLYSGGGYYQIGYDGANYGGLRINHSGLDLLTILTTGNVGINETSPTAKLQVKGSGTTSSTTSLLVQNSAGSNAIKITDDAQTFLYGTFGVNQTHHYSHNAGGAYRQSDSYSIIDYLRSYGSSYLVLGGYSANYIFELKDGFWTRVKYPLCVSTTFNSPNASAVLQADSTTQGFLPPRMSTTAKTAIASPAAGLMVYDTTLNQMSYYNGSTWVNF